MNKKQLIITLIILFYCPVFAHARLINSRVRHNKNHGEFASPSGVFNFKLDSSFDREFTIEEVLPRKSIFKDENSGKFKNPSNIFSQEGNEFKSSSLTFEMPQNEFSSDGSVSDAEQLKSEKEAFKSSDKDDFQFFLPKEKRKNK
ncbi:MAG: hypothetical protein PHC37_04340 [Candidatus Omnitrophica bacterium]|nr:hypothetical protein [Candidatus Omnitrophota bacterium]MDD5690904.1 hypothetical protein [Candidatus Omnitrophota bacterium]